MGSPEEIRSERNRLGQQICRESERPDAGKLVVVVGCSERYRPAEIPDGEVRGRHEEEARGEGEARVAVGSSSRKPQKSDHEQGRRQSQRRVARETQRLESMRNRVPRLEVRVARKRCDRTEPPPAVAPGRQRGNSCGARHQPEDAKWAASRAPLEQVQTEK